ncbi:MAG: hypothetical protein ABIK43_05865 [candidate division WOR-3 bacterium]
MHLLEWLRRSGAICFLALFWGAVQAQPKERIDAEPEVPLPAPGRWIETDTVESRQIFEEDTNTAGVWDTGFCFLRISSDTFPAPIYVDGRQFIQVDTIMMLRTVPGRHHVSYFPLHRVQLAFRKEIPVAYWQLVSEYARPAGEYDLISAHDASAVREGTRWVRPGKGDTVSVSLSWQKTRTAYSRTGRRTAVAIFGITTAIAVAMVISEALVEN